MAWTDRYAVERWIDRSVSITPLEREYYRSALAHIRERRYSVEQFRPGPRTMTELVEDRTSDSFGSRRMDVIVHVPQTMLPMESLVAEIVDDTTYYPVSINAAVFDGNLHAQSALCALDVGPMSGAEVDRIGCKVVELAAAISNRAAGLNE